MYEQYSTDTNVQIHVMGLCTVRIVMHLSMYERHLFKFILFLCSATVRALGPVDGFMHGSCFDGGEVERICGNYH
jgi:hypothetical protein